MLQSAIYLASLGFKVFPLRVNSKLPLIDDFPNQATSDVEKIKTWWVDPILGLEQPYNIGISTTSFGKDNSGLIVVDVDNKGAKKGDDEVFNLEMDGYELPPTLTQYTPTGGKHLIYSNSIPVKQGVKVLGNSIDIRSKGGYIVGAGSTIDGVPYTLQTIRPIRVAPKWVVDKCGEFKEKKIEKVDLSKIDKDAAIERAIFYLENEAPESVKGSGGDHTAYKVAAKVKDFGIDRDTCLELMLDHWFNGSGWTPEKLQLKIDHAYRYGLDPVGSAAPENDFEKIEDVELNELNESYLQKLNKEYALIYMEGTHFILHETIDEKGKPKRAFLSEQTFRRKFSPFTVQSSGSWAKIWLDWKNRREYQGVCFAPEREARNGYYNLWRGFTCTPLPYDEGTKDQKSGFDAFISHAKENICRGNEELFNWLMGYFAHLIQRPFEKPLTTIVFRGGKGVGKNALIDRIGAIIGVGQYLVAHDGRYLTSNFNGHFDSCLCLVLDEAFWSGDKAAEGKLKGLTTSPDILIEKKGREPYTVDNLLRMVIIGNEYWLVPASSDERRYGVFDVGDGKKQDTKFFHNMRVNLDDKGGNRILLDYLKNFDLSTVEVNIAPKTAALLEQKERSLEPLQQFWFDCLCNGGVVGSEWQFDVGKADFRSAFFRYCKERGIRSRLPDERSIGKVLKTMVPSLDTSKNKRVGTELYSLYRLPDLNQCRKEWSDFMGQEVLWD